MLALLVPILKTQSVQEEASIPTPGTSPQLRKISGAKKQRGSNLTLEVCPLYQSYFKNSKILFQHLMVAYQTLQLE